VNIFFIGVGDACDTAHGNTSALVTTANNSQVLLDCGFSVPHTYFRTFTDPDKPDSIWISHFHGDHFFGLPLIFLRLWQMQRSRPLIIVGQPGIEEKVWDVLELAYPGFAEKLSFELQFHTIRAGETLTIGDMSWSTVQTRHTQYNLGLLLDDGSRRLYYSGDGLYNQQVKELLDRGCDFMIHEAFTMVDEFPYHGSITSCLELADSVGVRRVALVHLDRDFRKNESKRIEEIIRNRPGTMLPVSGNTIAL